jgi:hypothetical protein
MTTVLEEYTIEEKRSVVRCLWVKGLNAKDIHKEMFLVTVGSVYRVKRSQLGREILSRTFENPGRPVENATEATVQRDNSQKTSMPRVSTH